MSISHEIAELLLTEGAVLFRPNDPITFTSGIRSPIYCDNRLLLSSAKTRKKVVDAYLLSTDSFRFDVIAGVATAGIAWGAWIAERLNSNYIYVRGAAKEHGKKNQIEGKLKPGSKVLMIEDLISTGGSVLAAADAVLQAGSKMVGIVSIFSYGFEESTKAFQEKGIETKSIVTVQDLIEVGRRLQKISAEDEKLILNWQKDPRSF